MHNKLEKKTYFFGILEVTDEKRRIRIWARKLGVGIQGSGSGSVPKCHGSGTLLMCTPEPVKKNHDSLYLRVKRKDF